MDVTRRLDRFQQRHKVLGFPIACVYKFYDDQGFYLAALITYYAFLAIFPLLLLATSLLGYILQGNPELQARILDTALTQFPVLGDQLGRPEGLQGSSPAVIIGAIGALYGALGIGQAGQNAMNVAWGIPRNKRPNPFLSRLRSLRLISIAGLAVLLTTTLTISAANLDVFALDMGVWALRLLTVGTVLVNTAMFMLIFRHAPARELRRRDVFPGAAFAGGVWHLLQLAGTSLVSSVVDTASSMNAVFAVVLGLVIWIFLSAVIVVAGIEINAVRVLHLHPRALLTLFTDNVDLTEADRRAYALYVLSQRHKDIEDINIDWTGDQPPPAPPADISRYREKNPG